MTKKTWIWIIVAVFGMCVVAVLALAAAGIYFVGQHVSTARATSSEAERRFTEVKALFKGQPPLLDIDSYGRPHTVRPLHDLPTSTVKAENLWILAWDSHDERVARISLPFWMMRFGKRKLDITSGDRTFDFNSLDLDINELERIGPALILDVTRPTGERVLVWTQ
jgi:hypothetical protein